MFGVFTSIPPPRRSPPPIPKNREPGANYAAFSRLRESDVASRQLLEMCRQCTGHPTPPAQVFGPESCGSLECPVYFERHRAMLRGRDARELCDALGLLSTP